MNSLIDVLGVRKASHPVSIGIRKQVTRNEATGVSSGLYWMLKFKVERIQKLVETAVMEMEE